MSWLYSQALVAEYSAENFSDGEQCALWNGTHTQQASWLSAKTTGACRLSRSGMTFKPLTDDLGGDVLTSFLADFPVRISHAPEKGRESKVSEAVCGDTWRESSVKYCRNSSSWKTHRCLWEEDLETSSLTLPRWGMMLDGILWERTTPERLTSATESGLQQSWPTPRAGKTTDENEETWMVRHKAGKVATPPLSLAVKMWATPCASDNRDRGNLGMPAIRRRASMGKQIMLSMSVSDTSGALNPEWVEWLMGWPVGWTDLRPLETDRFHAWLNSHGISCDQTGNNTNQTSA